MRRQLSKPISGLGRLIALSVLMLAATTTATVTVADQAQPTVPESRVFER